MAHYVEGIGGVFFRAAKPTELSAWYEQHFGIPADPMKGGPWMQAAGPTVVASFDRDTDYFGSSQEFMLNFRVSDLAAFLADLKAAGINEVKPRETMAGVGTFGWVEDPMGRRVELWQPA